ncbi:mandelate racemase/muconate lactonizing enzyme family protein [Sporosarcina trichiuri]|uniref:mandelate racemase/muconate lactonizing enzyme family protein n=1 Tax=Sporosarcina trichiuri TaxID=3056445 RepID=UPI0025B377E8|nr:dipeptide epimerase [Sporosarcina sp. 0.2-SM1T-5]WJY26459.1 dipeptide epimerase [Sporosarcina sp. 0.2-SM1T-5]
MKITSIEVFAVRLPLKTPFIISYHTYKDMPSIFVKLHTDTGLTGYGEGTPDEHVTGETWEGVRAILVNTITPSVIGMNPFDLERIHDRMDKAIYGATTAKAAIDIACYDLMGKASGQPVFNLLGGRYHDQLEFPKVISILPPEEMAAEAKAAVNEGYRILKLKVGTDSQLDIERIRAVRQAVGDQIAIKVDANQGWETSAASMQVLDQIKDCRIDWIEQPVIASDMHGLKEIKQKTAIPVMIDEGLHGQKEMYELTATRSADMMNIKLMKCGGLYRAMQLVHQAELAGFTCQIGSMVESAVASAAGLHLATAKKGIQTNELVGPLMFSKDIARLDIDLPFVRLSETPGLGLNIDEATLTELTYTHDVIEQ